MPNFTSVLGAPDRLANAFKAIRVKLSPREFEQLGELYATSGGFLTSRDKGNRVRGDTVYSCSKIGAYLSAHLDGVGPGDSMMWIGFLQADTAEHQHWVMRPEVRLAIKSLGWY